MSMNGLLLSFLLKKSGVCADIYIHVPRFCDHGLPFLFGKRDHGHLKGSSEGGIRGVKASTREQLRSMNMDS